MAYRPNDKHLRTYYSNLKQLPLLYKYQFVVEFVKGGTIQTPPGIVPLESQSFYSLFTNTINSPDQTLTYYAQSASIPGVSIKNAQAKFFAGKFNVPTVIQYEHNWKIDIILDQDLTMYKKFIEWQKFMSDYKFSGGGVRVIPDISMRVNVLNSDHSGFTTSFILAGIWPNDVAQIDVSYDGNAQIKKAAIEFRYQYVYQDPSFDPQNLNDPLALKTTN